VRQSAFLITSLIRGMLGDRWGDQHVNREAHRALATDPCEAPFFNRAHERDVESERADGPLHSK